MALIPTLYMYNHELQLYNQTFIYSEGQRIISLKFSCILEGKTEKKNQCSFYILLTERRQENIF
jgi:hypothetical protein